MTANAARDTPKISQRAFLMRGKHARVDNERQIQRKDRQRDLDGRHHLGARGCRLQFGNKNPAICGANRFPRARITPAIPDNVNTAEETRRRPASRAPSACALPNVFVRLEARPKSVMLRNVTNVAIVTQAP